MDLNELSVMAGQALGMDAYPDARFPPSPYYRFLRLLAERVRPGICVELGVCGGGGSLHMCLGTDSKVLGVDIANAYPDQLDYVKIKHRNFEFWHMDSIDAARFAWQKNRYPVGLLFMDTVHTYGRTLAEYRAWKWLLDSDTSVVCIDDLCSDGMDRVWEYMPEPKVRLDMLHPPTPEGYGGFGAVITGGG